MLNINFKNRFFELHYNFKLNRKLINCYLKCIYYIKKHVKHKYMKIY